MSLLQRPGARPLKPPAGRHAEALEVPLLPPRLLAVMLLFGVVSCIYHIQVLGAAGRLFSYDAFMQLLLAVVYVWATWAIVGGHARFRLIAWGTMGVSLLSLLSNLAIALAGQGAQEQLLIVATVASYYTSLYMGAYIWFRPSQAILFCLCAALGMCVIVGFTAPPASDPLFPSWLSTVLSICLSQFVFVLIMHNLGEILQGHRESRLQVQQLREDAERDVLTGLMSRRAMQARLARVLELPDHPDRGALLMVDIDHFQRHNERLGTATADTLLLALAALLQQGARAHGAQVARWGGEEFLLLCPLQMSGISAPVLAERLRQTVAQHVWAPDGVLLTISIGMTRLQEGDTVAGALERADRALHLAKHGGRNQVVAVDAGGEVETLVAQTGHLLPFGSSPLPAAGPTPPVGMLGTAPRSRLGTQPLQLAGSVLLLLMLLALTRADKMAPLGQAVMALLAVGLLVLAVTPLHTRWRGALTVAMGLLCVLQDSGSMAFYLTRAAGSDFLQIVVLAGQGSWSQVALIGLYRSLPAGPGMVGVVGAALSMHFLLAGFLQVQDAALAQAAHVLRGSVDLNNATVVVLLGILGQIQRSNQRRGQLARRLTEALERDALTGVPGRAVLLRELERVLAPQPPQPSWHARAATPAAAGCALILLDIDHFRRINDDHDHGTGDAVLMQMGRMLQDLTPDGAMVGRWGGEEFLIIDPCRDAGLAHALAAQILARVQASVWPVGVTVSASVGVGWAAVGTRPDDALQQVGMALQGARRAGRGQVVCAPATSPPPAG